MFRITLIKFHSDHSKPDIIATSKFSIAFLFYKFINTTFKCKEMFYAQPENRLVDNVLIHPTAGIILQEIDALPLIQNFYLSVEYVDQENIIVFMKKNSY